MHCIHPSVHPSIQWHTTAACIKIAGIAINLLGDRCAILLTTSSRRSSPTRHCVPWRGSFAHPTPQMVMSRRGQWGCLMLGGWVYKPYRTGKSSLEDRFYWNFEPWSSGLNAPAWYGLRSFSRWIGWSSMLVACLKKSSSGFTRKNDLRWPIQNSADCARREWALVTIGCPCCFPSTHNVNSKKSSKLEMFFTKSAV